MIRGVRPGMRVKALRPYHALIPVGATGTVVGAVRVRRRLSVWVEWDDKAIPAHLGCVMALKNLGRVLP